MAEKAENKIMEVTSLEEMRAQALSVVAIPGWDDRQEIYVRLKRVSLITLIENDVLPNELLSLATKAATAGKEYNPVTGSSPEEFKNFGKLLKIIAQQALVEPTYEEIVENVNQFTDEQLTSIYVYCVGGLRKLESFRQKPEYNAEIRRSSKNVRGKTE